MTELNTSDGLSLHSWRTSVESPKATVAIVHGYGEHSERYRHVAAAFEEKGLATIAVDLRGHGKSPGRRGYVERFSEYHADLEALLEEAKRMGGGSTFLFGHSMGALVCLDWLLEKKREGLAGLVLTSPFLGVAVKVNPAKEMLGKLASRALPTLSLPSGLNGADVTKDETLARLYDEDPLNNKNATARWFTEAVAAMERVQSRVGALDVPLLLLYAGDDRVVKASESDRLAKNLTMSDREVERLDGYYHEVVNAPEADRAKVIARIANWIEARASKDPASAAEDRR